MKFKLLLIAIAVCVFAAWVNVNVVWADEQPTRTFYNNKVPYKALFGNHQTNQINVQAQTKQGKVVQAVIPVVNDKENDPTQQTKGN
jgi:hypothetical protein